jgi:hypothetical protein
MVQCYVKYERNMKEIDQMLDQWIHSSIIRAKLRELIVDECFKTFHLGVEHKEEMNYKLNTNEDG